MTLVRQEVTLVLGVLLRLALPTFIPALLAAGGHERVAIASLAVARLADYWFTHGWLVRLERRVRRLWHAHRETLP